MENYNVFRPAYTMQANVCQTVAEVCAPYGKKVVVIGGRTALMKMQTQLTAALAFSSLKLVDFVWYGGEASSETVKKLLANQSVKKAEMIFAVGGGRVMDACKVVADCMGKPMFAFPTILSNCAASTAVSVLHEKDGAETLHFCKKAPVHLFLDSRVLAEAPRSFLWAGIGDMLLRREERIFADCAEALEPAKRLGTAISRRCNTLLHAVGAAALEDCDRNLASEALTSAALGLVVTAGMMFVPLLSGYHSAAAPEHRAAFCEVLRQLACARPYTDAERAAACSELTSAHETAAAAC